MEFVAALQPKFFLMENVPALAGKRGKAILDEALSFIESRGYRTESRVLDASHFGVPQRRKRRFVLGELTDSPFMTVSLPNGVLGSAPTVREAISHYPVPPHDGSDHESIRHHRRDRLSSRNLERMAALKGGQGRQDLPDELLANCHRRSADQIGHRNVYGRMEWDSPAPTITARFDSFTRGQFGHPEQDRTITLREGATLQSFPETYDFVGNKVDVARQIGNAVPPKLAKAIGLQILAQVNN
jgi:DNA (cytosine-5)-methyltransferase 1